MRQSPGTYMTEREWLEIGRTNGVIDVCRNSEVFGEIYKKWFLMKMNCIKPQSLDRIECTYNKYYRDTSIESMPLHKLDTMAVSNYLTDLLIRHGSMTPKEFKRVYQIVNNVLLYALDLRFPGSQLIDWGLVRRYLPSQCIIRYESPERVISDNVIACLERKVIRDKVYSTKHSACLCLVLNFYLGLRVGELAALRWSDIDEQSGVVHVHTTETKAFERCEDGERSDRMLYLVSDTTKTPDGVRNVPLIDKSRWILGVLREHHACCGYQDECLAYDGTDTALVRSLDRTLRRLCELCDVQPFPTHMIRKTFASRLHHAGVPTRMISDLLGHREMSTTERYYIRGYEDRLERMRFAMDSVFPCSLDFMPNVRREFGDSQSDGSHGAVGRLAE